MIMFEVLAEEVPTKKGKMTRLEMSLRDLIDSAVEGNPKAVMVAYRLMREYDNLESQLVINSRARVRAAVTEEKRRRTEERWAQEDAERQQRASGASTKPASETESSGKSGDKSTTETVKKAEERSADDHADKKVGGTSPVRTSSESFDDEPENGPASIQVTPSADRPTGS
jgi:Mg-chelatase subunit ChlI